MQCWKKRKFREKSLYAKGSPFKDKTCFLTFIRSAATISSGLYIHEFKLIFIFLLRDIIGIVILIVIVLRICNVCGFDNGLTIVASFRRPYLMHVFLFQACQVRIHIFLVFIGINIERELQNTEQNLYL